MVVYSRNKDMLLVFIEVQSSPMLFTERKAILGAANVIQFLCKSTAIMILESLLYIKSVSYKNNSRLGSVKIPETEATINRIRSCRKKDFPCSTATTHS